MGSFFLGLFGSDIIVESMMMKWLARDIDGITPINNGFKKTNHAENPTCAVQVRDQYCTA
jgi:hypothetical protein